MGSYWGNGYWGGGQSGGYWTDGYWWNSDATTVPSDEFDSLYWRILKAVKAALQSGNFLEGIDADRIYLQKSANWRDPVVDGVTTELDLPCVIVYPPDGPRDTDRGTNARDDIGYPVGIVWVFPDKQDQVANFSRELQYQSRIRKRFCRRRLGVDNDYGVQFTCVQESATTLDAVKFYREGLTVGLMRLRFMCRESRDYEND